MSLSGMAVLLAEDNPTNQMVAMQMLESLGAEVTLAVDGAEALEILQERSFDAALIDIEMPRVSGIDLIRRVRESSEPVAELPMIALTAYVMREHRVAIEEAGADGIIAKPILSIEKFGEEILGFVRDRRDEARGRSDAAAAAASGEAAGIDREVFDRLCASFDSAGREELAERVHDDIGSAKATISEALATRDLDALRSSTHILISVAGAIGATKLQSLAQCLNSAGHSANISLIDRDGPKLLAESERVLEFVRSG